MQKGATTYIELYMPSHRKKSVAELTAYSTIAKQKKQLNCSAVYSAHQLFPASATSFPPPTAHVFLSFPWAVSPNSVCQL